MSHGGKACKDCGEEIAFIQGGNGKWIPVVPGTEERHRCKLDQRCEGCQEIFQGAPWMKTCPGCYRSGHSAENPKPKASAPSQHRPETLQNDFADGEDPF